MSTTHILFLYLAQFFLEWEMFQTKVVGEIKTHFVFNKFFENRAVYEIMWKNTVQRGIPRMTWRTRIACWITKDKHTHNMQYFLLFYCNSSCKNAPYVVLTLPVFSLRYLSFPLSFNECS
jgi:hypothetical protein